MSRDTEGRVAWALYKQRYPAASSWSDRTERRYRHQAKVAVAVIAANRAERSVGDDAAVGLLDALYRWGQFPKAARADVEAARAFLASIEEAP